MVFISDIATAMNGVYTMKKLQSKVIILHMLCFFFHIFPFSFPSSSEKILSYSMLGLSVTLVILSMSVGR